ncbi:MAG: hypothetical protein GY706_02015 [Bacteroides sp.]|nr:hypothetical protein [Bacteroides sp.]
MTRPLYALLFATARRWSLGRLGFKHPHSLLDVSAPVECVTSSHYYEVTIFRRE